MENTNIAYLLTFDEQTIGEIYQYALKFTDNTQLALLLTHRTLPHIVDYNRVPECSLRYKLKQHAKQVVWVQFMALNENTPTCDC